MKLSRALSAVLPFPSSSSQAGKWLLLRTATALQASSLSTDAVAKPTFGKSTRTGGHSPAGAEADTQPGPSEEKGEPGGPPPRVPAKVEEAGPRLPKPSEIPWQAQVANSVRLIGRVGTPVQLGATPDGAYMAATVLVHEKTHDLPQFWIPIVFQGDLAQIAACNLREKDHVYVTGQLTGGSQLIDGNAETKMEVMVHSISYVLDLRSGKRHDRKNEGLDNSSVNAKKSGESTLGYWNDLVENPRQWWDNREDKLSGNINPKSPDFSHKVTRKGLWLNAAPDWVLPKLKSQEDSGEACWQTEAKKISSRLTKKEDLWRNLMENPEKWRDQRSNKSNPNAPDFKHKETGEALWLDCTVTPKWVLEKFLSTDAENQ